MVADVGMGDLQAGVALKVHKRANSHFALRNRSTWKRPSAHTCLMEWLFIWFNAPAHGLGPWIKQTRQRLIRHWMLSRKDAYLCTWPLLMMHTQAYIQISCHPRRQTFSIKKTCKYWFWERALTSRSSRDDWELTFERFGGSGEERKKGREK